jgi:hypothetical protein
MEKLFYEIENKTSVFFVNSKLVNCSFLPFFDKPTERFRNIARERERKKGGSVFCVLDIYGTEIYGQSSGVDRQTLFPFKMSCFLEEEGKRKLNWFHDRVDKFKPHNSKQMRGKSNYTVKAA